MAMPINKIPYFKLGETFASLLKMEAVTPFSISANRSLRLINK
jgi:hypothetical protein